MTVTLRDYPVTHCDDRHQASGGPIRGFAVQGSIRVVGPIALESLDVAAASALPTGAVGVPRRHGVGAEPTGVLAAMGAVVASHATDLWGVVLVTVGVLAALAFYGGDLPRPGRTRRPGGGRGPARLGPLPACPWWPSPWVCSC